MRNLLFYKNGNLQRCRNVQKVFTILDQEVATHKLNINQLAGITGVHRQTVAARLKNVPPAPGSNSKLKLYLITDVLTELMIPSVSVSTENMQPSDNGLNIRLVAAVSTRAFISGCLSHQPGAYPQ